MSKIVLTVQKNCFPWICASTDVHFKVIQRFCLFTAWCNFFFCELEDTNNLGSVSGSAPVDQGKGLSLSVWLVPHHIQTLHLVLPPDTGKTWASWRWLGRTQGLEHCEEGGGEGAAWRRDGFGGWQPPAPTEVLEMEPGPSQQHRLAVRDKKHKLQQVWGEVGLGLRRSFSWGVPMGSEAVEQVTSKSVPSLSEEGFEHCWAAQSDLRAGPSLGREWDQRPPEIPSSLCPSHL